MMEKKQKVRQSLRQRFTEALALQPISEGGGPQLLLEGDRCLTIRQHCGLLEYSESQIRVAARQYEICVCGRNMLLQAMDGDDICICGQIFSVEYRAGERTE